MNRIGTGRTRSAEENTAVENTAMEEAVMAEEDIKSLGLDPVQYRYLLAQAEPPTPVQRRLIAQTRALGPASEMQIPHEQGVLLTLLCRIAAARLVVEVGTFTGYSTLALALGLPPGGRVLTFDISEEWTGVALAAWRDAGVAERIETRLGPAAERLRELPEEPMIDLVFLDADKPGYDTYWELLVPRVRPGGLLLADNVLYAGEAADPRCTGNGRAIRLFNERVRADSRVESVMLPLADGLTIARRLPPSGTGPSGTGPSGTGPSGTGPSDTRPSGTHPSRMRTSGSEASPSGEGER
ncbi:O-methyltransferase [Streptomyces clavuligerus]|uniref:Caffeoyl O-methyltransferase n=2 Tax=Streptomyces clavuligerus TaxID=1901 RepID=D5SLM7_STRCL|nr:class I SAM-dependent methyltransferase [Streptomyces clavuligerus]EFG04820.1 Caffeoyl O-methyltransferase [Streptomyces clavuligerus]MBY6306732.1 class I SAM-dependent methyltransferase [Streptomyces clavuligerus]QCS10661.1 O-methyltransferase [Streptomyces clavuligerus]QPJ97302.1 O-methyltransferase [Streptomyces clavuligerus]